MKAIYLLMFFTILLISFDGCKNKTSKNNVNYPAEAFYNEFLPGELQNFASIEFVSQDDSMERITMHLKNPQLEFSTGKSEWVTFSQAVNMFGNDVGIAFTDSVGNERAILRMKENIPTGFLLIENGKDKLYSIAKYATFEIYESESADDEYFESVLDDLEQKSSRTDKIPQGIKNLVPSNSELYFCAMGDLNRDKYNDAILIITGEYLECWILTGITNDSFKINIIKKIDDINDVFFGLGYFSDARAFDDPLFDIVIKNGFFSVERYRGVSGNNKSIDVTHFKYSKEDNNWILFRRDYIPNRFSSGCNYDYHLTTYFVEKILFENYKS
ncbi:MAG: hypothetical protein LBS55_08400 [Prevotellaceae bacterium]|nr:hypothetical protein [Prevotellaceae bacterium]